MKLEIGQSYALVLPYSEVAMHLRVAGYRRIVTVLPHGAAQILNADLTKFSFPVTWGEAGIYRDAQGQPYVTDEVELIDVEAEKHASEEMINAAIAAGEQWKEGN